MWADYDSQGDTVQIELERVRRLDRGEDVDGGSVIVGIAEGRPVRVDVLSAGRCGVEAPLAAVAERHGLDAEALIAAAQAALAAPDRTVMLAVGVQAAA